MESNNLKCYKKIKGRRGEYWVADEGDKSKSVNTVGGYLNILMQNDIKRLFKDSKGGAKMEVKSRYEVISELEEKKRSLIRERDNFPDRIKSMKKEIRELERDLEDRREELKEFEESVEERKETIKELIKGVDDSLARFSELNKSKS